MILMLAGTSDARELAVMIQQAGYSVTATVVTDHAAEQLRSSGIRAYVGRLDASQLADLAKAEGAKAIVDASHPFAEEASKNAMQASAAAELPYIRYERQASSLSSEKVTFVDSYEEAAELAAEKGGVVMLTTGSKTLDIFAARLIGRPDVKVIARMLPRKDNLDKCERLGFSQEQIVMMQGPFTKELDRALYRHFGVTVVVTKESGKVGLVDEKIAAAEELGIDVIVIRRPRLSYGIVHHDFAGVLEALKQHAPLPAV
ncbi:precorrin-6A reductase [Geobacillus stearothermophilus]|uniref:Cobalt-precorrin-6x reductase n=1 Tax=Geobacillus stearothermophilus TaxID=1422 RepID=A0A150NDI3_GEOSE|nr:precorrin-6A reductase [Geobacillus stearothermophilus]KOR94985.1 precorrin-6x reductase [Geobacillus stearothermophilus ATCC 12980]KYD20085.1 Cobalt-precorrin-6x reductase [Geobacillus stearothermophilus]KYD34778.1 Cobalt-precorrin-6x reductase [Geobacillus stearothermophilus]MED3663507.1 precorrin-6A reductase [Geobacillus stearothermophilus]MED3721078.1 precorrin-6A reductase [Geobacillus stearothermophilus]